MAKSRSRTYSREQQEGGPVSAQSRAVAGILFPLTENVQVQDKEWIYGNTQVTTSVTKLFLEEFDQVTLAAGYKERAEAIREAMRRFMPILEKELRRRRR